MRFKHSTLIPWFFMAAVIILFAVMVAGQNRTPEREGLPVKASATGERRVILLVVDRITYPEMRAGSRPALSSLMEQSAVGLMNVRSGRPGSESGYLSMGAGARAVAGLEGSRAHSFGELVDGQPAEVLFHRHTGRLPAGEVFHLQASVLQEKNSVLDYPVNVGLMGRLLAEENFTAAVVGNADGAGPGRSAVMIAMDPGGEVPLGFVGPEMLLDDPLAPYGKRSDIDMLGEAAAHYLRLAHLVVVEFGDMSRLDQYWPQLGPEQRAVQFALTMERLDNLLELLIPLVDDATSLIMVTPSPPGNRPGGGEQLTPFLVTLSGDSGGGLAVSSSTRRPGLVTSSDMVPLVLSYLKGKNLPAPHGQVLEFIPGDESLTVLDQFYEQSYLVFNLRPPLLRGYVLALIIVLLVSLAGLALKQPLVLRAALIMEGIMLVPLVLLVLPGLIRFPLPSTLWTGVILAGTTIVLVLLLQPLKRQERHLLWAVLGLATALVLVLDTLTGARLQQVSFLGYDTITGARYYGVGNEYMGALIGSTILGTVSLAAVVEGGERPGWLRRGWYFLISSGTGLFYLGLLLVYGLIVFMLASPQFGANLGGTVSAAVAFGVAWTGMLGIMEKGHVLILFTLGFILVALVLLWILNIWWQPELPSHLGRFGEMVRMRGFAGVWETVLRKVNMNWKLVRYSIWSRAFVTLLGLFMVLSFYPSGVLRRLKQEQPYLVTGAIAALAGSVTALLTNDSGIVAAATVLLYGVPPLLISIVGKSLGQQA